jgi:hypothetical protein
MQGGKSSLIIVYRERMRNHTRDIEPRLYQARHFVPRFKHLPTIDAFEV